MLDGDGQVISEKGADGRPTSYIYNPDSTTFAVVNGKGRAYKYRYDKDLQVKNVSIFRVRPLASRLPFPVLGQELLDSGSWVGVHR